MPATAGRVRMPANNRVHSSAALQTHGIWQSAIGYDPYAPNKEDNKKSAQPQSSSAAEPEGENAYASFQGLLALARITGSNADEARGSCKKCGRVGHLTFQCRNFLSIKDDKDKDPEAIQAAVMSGLEKIKGHRKRSANESSDESDEDESESSDSDYDSEIERAIAKKYGKGLTSKLKSSRKKRDDDDDSDEDDSDSKDKKKRGRSKKRSVKRSTSDTDDDQSGRKRRKEKRRRKEEESSDEDRERRSQRRKSRKEKRRRRSHRHSDDSDSSEDSIRRHKRKSKSRRAALSSDSDASGFEDSRVGREKRRIALLESFDLHLYFPFGMSFMEAETRRMYNCTDMNRHTDLSDEDLVDYGMYLESAFASCMGADKNLESVFLKAQNLQENFDDAVPVSQISVFFK
ncbi:CAX-interacting protein 4 [Tanacetum coccineum]